MSKPRQASLFLDAGAMFDASGAYRYTLWRTWDKSLPVVVWIMLNPSTADEFVLDPTITRCVAFSRAWGFGGLIVVNLFALKSTDPKALYSHVDPVGPKNDAAILEAIESAALVMAAWGVHGKYTRRGADMMELITRPVECLGVTKEGFPKHPLYVAASTERQPYVVEAN